MADRRRARDGRAGRGVSCCGRGSAHPRPSARLSLELPAPLTFGDEFAAPFALAPDGSLLAVEATEGGTRRLYLRELRDPALRRLAGTDGAWQPFFSPDGQWVAFFTNRKLAKVAVGGGPVLEVADVGGNPRGATWAPDGTMVVAATQTAGLLRVPDRGGAAGRAHDARQVARRILASLARCAAGHAVGPLHGRLRGRDLRRRPHRSRLARRERRLDSVEAKKVVAPARRRGCSASRNAAARPIR